MERLGARADHLGVVALERAAQLARSGLDGGLHLGVDLVAVLAQGLLDA